jgi:hypothetical protein
MQLTLVTNMPKLSTTAAEVNGGVGVGVIKQSCYRPGVAQRVPGS